MRRDGEGNRGRERGRLKVRRRGDGNREILRRERGIKIEVEERETETWRKVKRSY